MRAGIAFLLYIIIFGTLRAGSNLSEGEAPLKAFAEGYFLPFALMGMVYFNSLILAASIPRKLKFLSVLLLAISASVLAYLFYSMIGRSGFDDPVTIGWNEADDGDALPISGGMLIAGLVGFLYLFCAFSMWFWHKFMHPTPRKN